MQRANEIIQTPAATHEKSTYYTASHWQLIWRRFRRNRLALLGIVLLFIYLMFVLFAEFIAPHSGTTRDPAYLVGPPQPVHFCDSEGCSLRPFIHGYTTERNPSSFKLEISVDESTRHYIQFFVAGEPYKLLGLIDSDIHLFGVPDGMIHLFGTDDLGRDVFARVIYGTRVSLTIGVIGVLIAFVIGLIVGGIAGYSGGKVDFAVQRLIEFVRSIPTLPLYMGLAAALPKEWTPIQVYFTISLILGFLGWTTLARRIRGKLLSLRHEEFVVAAIVSGAAPQRIIVKHMLPSFLSYIIVDLTVSFPYMILAETALSFIGLGLRPPVISWGVLLQASQNIRSIEQAPWMFIPAVFVIIAVLAFTFVGDGLRDAADPYS